ncbi:MAG: transposase, partial [Clostridia bacterium]|nr:transposase [Clostridia bacterium]
MENELPKRKPNRLDGFDYNSSGAYFITICTKDRKEILSNITVGTGVLDCPKTKLSCFGEIADKYIKQLSDFYENLSVDYYVIMPNHIHLLICVYDSGQSRTPVPTRQNSIISRFVSTFKRFCNKEYGFNPWQGRFHDHIIRNRDDYEE